MGSITNSLNGLSYLTQPGGPLSNLPASLTKTALQSASPQDLASLSMAALQAQNVSELFGSSQGSQNPLLMLPIAAQSATDLLPGVPAADLAGATPQQQAAINNQALLLQQVQGLFAEPASATATTNVLG